MAAAAQPGGSTDASHNRTVISATLIVGLIAIIIFTVWILHRMRPPVTAFVFAGHPRMDEEQLQKGVRGYILESLPVVKYRMRLRPNDQERVSEFYDSASITSPLRREVPTTTDGGKLLHINAEAVVAARAAEHKKGTTVKNSGRPNNNIRIPLEGDASQNRDQSVSKHEPLSCSICTEDFVESDDVRLLPCGHIYRRRCIDPWLLDFAILVLLFLIQPLGTSKIGSSFAPIVIIWLLFNFCSGIYNLARYDHSVLKAWSPYFAGVYLARNGPDGWRSLGGLLLAFTGVEALFADLGAFSQRAIQLSWPCFAYPCLLLAYIGQAAYISADSTGTAVTNPFFYSVPPGTFYFSLVSAILAAIVASQAMITSTFQLLIQIMNMSYFPHIKAVHKSRTFHGQVYIPMANWLLVIGTVIVTAVYNNACI